MLHHFAGANIQVANLVNPLRDPFRIKKKSHTRSINAFRAVDRFNASVTLTFYSMPYQRFNIHTMLSNYCEKYEHPPSKKRQKEFVSVSSRRTGFRTFNFDSSVISLC